MREDFIFPDDLGKLADERLAIDKDEVASFLQGLDNVAFAGRITDITLKGSDSYVLTFCLDGRKSGRCILDNRQQAWLDAGHVTVMDLAVHYSGCIRPGFGRMPVQRTLF